MTLDLFKELLPSIMVEVNPKIKVDNTNYNSFIVNRALSHHYDCIFYANVVNNMSHIDSDMKYKYLTTSIRKYKRRYVPWVKREVISDDVRLIMDTYNISFYKAKEYYNLLTKEQLDALRQYRNIGGVKK